MSDISENEQSKLPIIKHPIKRLYNWVIHWSKTPYAVVALFILAFAESSFFPIPPDVLLIAMAIAIPKRSFRYAAYCTIASVAGGMLGYVFGLLLAAPFESLFEQMGNIETYKDIISNYKEYGAVYTFMAALTPIPYKLFTIGAGVAKVSFPVFLLASVVGRGLRFFLVATLIYFYGKKIQAFIDKYFNLVTIAVTVLLVGAFFLVKYVI